VREREEVKTRKGVKKMIKVNDEGESVGYSFHIEFQVKGIVKWFLHHIACIIRAPRQ
jgi:hypothetical protein